MSFYHHRSLLSLGQERKRRRNKIILFLMTHVFGRPQIIDPPGRPNGHRWSLVLMLVCVRPYERPSALTYVYKCVHTSNISEQANDRLCHWAWWVTDFARLVLLFFVDVRFLSERPKIVFQIGFLVQPLFYCFFCCKRLLLILSNCFPYN